MGRGRNQGKRFKCPVNGCGLVYTRKEYVRRHSIAKHKWSPKVEDIMVVGVPIDMNSVKRSPATPNSEPGSPQDSLKENQRQPAASDLAVEITSDLMANQFADHGLPYLDTVSPHRTPRVDDSHLCPPASRYAPYSTHSMRHWRNSENMSLGISSPIDMKPSGSQQLVDKLMAALEEKDRKILRLQASFDSMAYENYYLKRRLSHFSRDGM